MANINNKDEPSTAPTPDRWYNLNLGSSFKDHHPSSKFCTLRYEFKPASIDKNQTGTLTKNKDNRVTVEFQNNQQGKPKVTFEGSSEEYKDNDAVLFFDGETFRLERLHRAVKRLRHVRTRGESAASVAGANTVGMNAVDASSPPVGKANKFQSANKGTNLPVEVERIEIGDFKSLDSKPRTERTFGSPTSRPSLQNTSPDMKSPDAKIDDLDEQLDILNNDDEDAAEESNRRNVFEKEFHSGIDINMPQQNDTDDEIAEIDVSDDDVDKGPNAAEALREQDNAEGRAAQTSSSSSSESGSSGSGSKSSSESGSGSGSSSSDGGSSDEVTSI
ncbi:hypothetical protein DCAR_0312196 [Daucus carota subsp. sativus]|uniref:Transcription elongation factor Eaf N-terminal domain-containing protein n=1 Tax=Daucus carota subsp. sativus TaxID=79200 RepID=A0AAF0WR39_DAUCS|nr:hypothetical protein DCAR_0312196 [Daucus carota subsp. sativus]